jgi:hypothetical protein
MYKLLATEEILNVIDEICSRYWGDRQVHFNGKKRHGTSRREWRILTRILQEWGVIIFGISDILDCIRSSTVPMTIGRHENPRQVAHNK